MAYKLIIADDEDIIRSGIMSVIDWDSLGFEAVADFDDGDVAMEYIRTNPVDVVLSDIRMSHVSGLQLAEYVHRYRPGTRVVLISGYKDFDYAKQAIRHHVASYITKPINFEEIYSLFRELKLDLDRERAEKSKEEDQAKRYKELLPLMQEQFLADLLLGVLRNAGEMDRRIRMLGMDMNVYDHPCFAVELEAVRLDEFLQGSWQQGRDGLKSALQHFLMGESDGIRYYPVMSHRKEMALLAVGPAEGGAGPGMAERVDRYLHDRREAIRQVLGLELQARMEGSWNSILEMAAHAGRKEPIAAAGAVAGYGLSETAACSALDFIRSGRLKKLADIRELFLPYVHTGDREAAGNLLDGYLKELEGLSSRHTLHFLTELFASLSLKLQAVGMDLWEQRIGDFSCYDLSPAPLAEKEKLREWCWEKLEGILAVMDRQRAAAGSWVLEKAEQYIRSNYQMDISLEDVAGQVFLSSAYFSQMFKEGKGINFSDYLVRIRMEKAMELLTHSQYKILEISQMVGYRSSKYFARSFKKAYGCTPTEYKMQFNRGGRA